jgi:hypothetical protein
MGSIRRFNLNVYTYKRSRAITTPARLAMALDMPMISAVDVFLFSGFAGTITSEPGNTLG